MSDTPAPAASTEEGSAKKKKPLLLIIVAVVMLGVGSGGAYFFLKRGSAAEAETAEKEKKAEKGKKKAKGEAEEEAEEEEPAPDEHATGEAGKDGKSAKPKFSIKKLDLPDDKEVKKIIELPPFVVNLADREDSRYLRMSVSIGVGESEEEKADPIMVTRVRNALLAVLTTKTADEILTQQGKSILRKELLKAARAAIEEPHIEAIYITDFIVQM